ncbi:carbon monoxide dehydrogenase E protein [Rhodococcus aetherivorans]|uniref:Carbon monoxide dehydrogenase E protein n=2 Tax=Rhodococcus aetherivorans TaxID=191292 RepID=A0ABQ0YEB4_9NOCA|nr:VWA domain-containing protein [Rhodococcus aetherivorans]ETT26710.1 VWA containing CoxE family protein [Rhodococcus rhodochrous ATCC 21198]NGP25984.1 VWA domain-containing protein [Rhodococcus aetherivorans]GES34853.1 carbon monoxide dehydrogenase E protein [Rhodococcus aetherivorans]
MSTALLLRGVDLAAFTVALTDRLRRAGVPVAATAAATLVRALRLYPPRTRSRLYWTARVALVDRQDALAAFDAVFAEVFDHQVLAVDPHARRTGPDGTVGAGDAVVQGAAPNPAPASPQPGVPWHTRRPRRSGEPPETVRPGPWAPSPVEIRADQPFADLRPEDLRTLGQWLEQARVRWPRRLGRRRTPHHHGRLDVRATLDASRHTGFELVRLRRARPIRRPRRIVVLCDVSRSMHGYADIYLHLMRAAVRAGDAEVFAFSTSLTRLTATLAHRSAEHAVARANDTVVDRYGGTHIAGSLEALLASHHGNLLRGAVVFVASDGWDSDDPQALGRAVARVRRRAHRLIWLNPRAGRPGYRPETGPMAAALPHCDALLAADTLDALRAVFDLDPAAGRVAHVSDGPS